MPKPRDDSADRAEEIRHIVEDPPYTPEGHTSLDALGDSKKAWVRDETYATVEGMAARRHVPRRGLRHPTEFEQVKSMAQNEGLTKLQIEKQLRMRHVMDGLPKPTVTLLVKRHVSRMTLQAIAAEEGVTPQAVAKRLETAKRDFYVAFTARWLEPLDTSLLLLTDGGLEREDEQ